MQSDDRLTFSVPVKVRTRRTLSGDGAIDVERSVSCPPRRRDVALHTCFDQPCCSGYEADELGAHVRCADPDLVGAQLVHLPVRGSAADALARERAGRTPVGAIMTSDVLCVRADVALEALEGLLLERDISGVPVVDANGKAIGIVSKTDLVREHYANGDAVELPGGQAARMRGYHESGEGRKVVADVMVGMAFTLPEDATVSQAAALMAFEGVHRVPVVCPEGKVVGMLSAIDILRWLAHADGYLLAARHT